MSSLPTFWNEFTAWLPHVQLAHFLIVSAILFALGLYGIVTRKNAILVLMGVELVLNAANINLIAFSRYSTLRLDGQVAAIFVIILAACEAAIALAIVLNIYHRFRTINVDEVSNLKE
ncbi:MAG: nuoK [Bacteroidetes bacterium]|jgi:NADH-quinone oxidoreductase subunit K|nr:nuoK [Bacteroidota bacterium]